MSQPPARRPLLEFPCDYQFKVFGPVDDDFVTAVQQTACTVMPISLDALRVRKSREGSYVCVTVLARLQHRQQLDALYSAFRGLPHLRYLL